MLNQRYQNIKLTRKHLSPEKYAVQAGIDQSMISYMEKDTKEITFPVLKNLYVNLGISPIFILTGDEDIESKKEVGSIIGTIVKDLRAELEVVKAELLAMKQNVRFLTKK